MSLIQGNTRWVLFLSASGIPEWRHVMDLVFGLRCLEQAGVAPHNIGIYVDGPAQPWAPWFALASNNTYQIAPTSQFFLDLAVNKHDSLVLFVTGHGSIDGIDAAPPIKPHALVTSLKQAPSLAHAVVYLGQCYAGIFNYIGAGKRVPNAAPGPEVILLGATSLHESISSSTNEQFLTKPVNWQANLFLLHVFKWISSPVDVDGDGKTTVIDSFKYAGVHSNGSNKAAKGRAFQRCMALHPLWINAQTAHTSSPTQQTALALQGISTQYSTALDFHAIHQECWILNAIPAQSLDF